MKRCCFIGSLLCSSLAFHCTWVLKCFFYFWVLGVLASIVFTPFSSECYNLTDKSSQIEESATHVHIKWKDKESLGLIGSHIVSVENRAVSKHLFLDLKIGLLFCNPRSVLIHSQRKTFPSFSVLQYFLKASASYLMHWTKPPLIMLIINWIQWAWQESFGLLKNIFF